mgnify:CR=1 FL=1
MRRGVAPAPRARSLPSVVDALFKTRGQTGATTGMMASSGGGVKRGREDVVDTTKCSDAEFDAWLSSSLAFQEPLTRDEMMHAWMALTSAATEALAEFAGESYYQSMAESMPPMSDEPTPQHFMGDYVDHAAKREDWERKQDEIQAHKDKALKLLARAQKVQAKMSHVV